MLSEGDYVWESSWQARLFRTTNCLSLQRIGIGFLEKFLEYNRVNWDQYSDEQLKKIRLIELIMNKSTKWKIAGATIPSLTLWAGLLLGVGVAIHAAEDRRAKVLNDRTEVQATGNWIYNDLTQGFAEAAKTRKPMLVIFRCVP